MIKEFNDVLPRDSAIIYASELEQIKKLFAEDPVLAGELAISAMELALTGQISSDNLIVQLSLEPMFKIGKQAKEQYDRRKENAQNKKIGQYKLDQIADMLNQGYNQSQIARTLGTSRQTISNRIKTIQKEFPQLLRDQGCQSDGDQFDNQMKMLDKMSSKNNQVSNESFEMLDKNSEMLDILSRVSNDVKRVKHNVNVNVNVNNDNLTQPDFITIEELDAMGCNYELRGSQAYIVDTGKVFNLKF